jgi:predicted exporter
MTVRVQNPPSLYLQLNEFQNGSDSMNLPKVVRQDVTRVSIISATIIMIMIIIHRRRSLRVQLLGLGWYTTTI